MIDDRARPRLPLARRSAAAARLRGRMPRTAAAGLLTAILLLDPGLVAAGGRQVTNEADGGAARSVAAADASLPVAAAQADPAAGLDSADSTDPASGPDPAVDGAPEADPDPAGPSIVAADAAAHANDRIDFKPGGRVTTPFVPRPDDGWSVGGGAPAALPAGAATGKALAASRQATVWAPGSTAAAARSTAGTNSVDLPGGFRSVGAAYPIAAQISPAGPLDAPTGTSLRRQVFGFLPYWELSDPSTTLDYELLSTIAYFGVGATATGDLLKRNSDGTTSTGWAGWSSARLAAVIDAAHARHTRVVLTVQSFAWTTGQARTQAALLGSPVARLNLARQVAAAVRDRGADGVNLDFEPLVKGREAAFVAFVRTLRAELDRIAKGYQLTFDTTGWIGNYPLEALTAPGAADAVFVMGYDYRIASSSSAGSVAPLNGPLYDLTDTAATYLERVPAAKLILGVPYYGRAWSTTSDALNATTLADIRSGPSASVVYGTAVDLAAQHGRRWDPVEQTAWLAYRRKWCDNRGACVTTWREVYYDDAASLRAKYDTINRYGLRGAGIWALGYDGRRPELYAAIRDKFVRDTTPPETGVSVLAPRQGDEGFGVAWTARDLSPIRAYDVQVSVDGGAWAAWRTATTETSGIYLGADGHRYAFRARATDQKGNVGAWDIATSAPAGATLARGHFAVVKTATLAARTRPSTAGGVIYRLRSGDIVALVGGPVVAQGITWFQVAGPIATWSPAAPVRSGSWVAASSAKGTYLVPRLAPNATVVDAGIVGFSFGTGGPASVGPSPAALAARSFSPNRDGSEDRLTLRWTTSVALSSLTLRVLRANGTLVGVRAVPPGRAGARSWVWDGSVGGPRLPDGRYLLQLVGKGPAGTFTAPSVRPTAAGQVAAFGVVLDTAPPIFGTTAISAALLSPNGDGRSDTVAVAGASTGATRWQLSVAPLAGGSPGVPIRALAGAGGTARASWDGKATDGRPVKDGRYRLTLAAIDDAGNASARSWDVTVDRTPPSLTPGPGPAAFSPDGDGEADRATIAWTSGEPAVARVEVRRGTKLIRTFAVPGPAATAGAVRWDGRDAKGRALADGTYLATILLQDPAGNRTAGVVPLRLDRTAGWLRWSPAAFYPQDGDALAASSRLTFRLGRAAVTSLEVVDARGIAVRTAWTNRTLRAGVVGWTWDGRIAGRAWAPVGTYTAVLVARSASGTTTLRRTILLDAFGVTTSATTLKAGQVLAVTIRPIEPMASAPTVTLTQAGRPAVSRVAAAVAGGWSIRFRIAAGGVGPASLRVAARDRGGRVDVAYRALVVR